MQQHIWVLSASVGGAADEFDVIGVFIDRLKAEQYAEERLSGAEAQYAIIERCTLDEMAEGWLMSEYDDKTGAH